MTTRQISTPFWKLDPSIIVLFFWTLDLRAVFFFQDSNAHSLQAPPRGLDGLGDGDGVEEVAQWGAGARLQPRQEQVQVHDEHCWQAGLWSTRLKVSLLVLKGLVTIFFRAGTRPGVTAARNKVPAALNRVPPTTGEQRGSLKYLRSY